MLFVCLSNHRTWINLFKTKKIVQSINYCAENIAYYSQKFK